MKETLFITGGLGMVGRELIKLFLKETNWKIIVLTHTQISESSLKKSFGNEVLIISERVKFVEGDITKENLGTEILTSEITHILHAAAITRFDLPLEVARELNVKGTENVIKFALLCPQLKQFGCLSTAYTSGKRTGKIYESEREHTEGFVNTYEQSKYEAEGLIEEYKGRLPAVTYRLSTIIGDSISGTVSHFTAPHQALRIMYLGLASMLPGTPNYHVDFISSDYSAQTVFKLFTQYFYPNERFHIVAGDNNSLELQELVDMTFEILGTLDQEWQRRNYPKPVIADAATFDLFIDSVEQADNPLLYGVLKALRHFAHQLNFPKSFDYSNVLKYIPSYDQEQPQIRNYYGKVIEYCLKSKWGKNV